MTSPISREPDRVHIQHNRGQSPKFIMDGREIGPIDFKQTVPSRSDWIKVDAVVNGALKQIFINPSSLEKICILASDSLCGDEAHNAKAINNAVMENLHTDSILSSLGIFRYDYTEVISIYNTSKKVEQFLLDLGPRKEKFIDCIIDLIKSNPLACQTNNFIKFLTNILFYGYEKEVIHRFTDLYIFPKILRMIVKTDKASYIPELSVYRSILLDVLKKEIDFFEKLPTKFQDDPEFLDAYKEGFFSDTKRLPIFETLPKPLQTDPQILEAYEKATITAIENGTIEAEYLSERFNTNERVLDAISKKFLDQLSSGIDKYYSLPTFLKEKPQIIEVYKFFIINQIKDGIRGFKAVPHNYLNDPLFFSQLIDLAKEKIVANLDSFEELSPKLKGHPEIIAIAKALNFDKYRSDWQSLAKVINTYKFAEDPEFIDACSKALIDFLKGNPYWMNFNAIPYQVLSDPLVQEACKTHLKEMTILDEERPNWAKLTELISRYMFLQEPEIIEMYIEVLIASIDKNFNYLNFGTLPTQIQSDFRVLEASRRSLKNAIARATDLFLFNDKLMDPEIALLLIKKFPKTLQTKIKNFPFWPEIESDVIEFYKDQIASRNLSLSNIPINFRYPDIWITALQTNPVISDFSSLPAQIQSDPMALEVCKKSLKKMIDSSTNLFYFDDMLMDQEIAFLLIKKFPKGLLYLKLERFPFWSEIQSDVIAFLKDQLSCKALTLSDIPINLRYPDIYMRALEIDPFEIKMVPIETLSLLLEKHPIVFQAFTFYLKKTHSFNSIASSELIRLLNLGLNAEKFSDYIKPLKKNLINKIENYRDELLKKILIINFGSGLVDWDFYEKTIPKTQWFALPLMILSTSGNKEVAKQIVEKARTFRLAFKSKETGLLQDFLSLQIATEDIDILNRSLDGVTDSGELKKRLTLLRSIFITKPHIVTEISNFHSENLIEILTSELISNGFIDSHLAGWKEGFMSQFVSSRNPGALFIYCSSFIGDELMKKPIHRFIQGVIHGTFISDRNAANTHIKYLNEKQKAAWEASIDETLISFEKKAVLFNPTEFLEEKLIADRHGSEDLIALIKSPSEPSHPMADVVNLLRRSTQKEEQIILLKQLLDLLKTDSRFNPLQFTKDIEDQIGLLTLDHLPSRDTLRLVDSDDWQDLFLCGTDVLGSCQRVDGTPTFTCALMGYVLDGKTRILAIKDVSGTIVARSIIKILVNKSKEPVLFLEPLYPDQIYLIPIINLAKQKAIAMGVPLYEASLEGEQIHSLGCAAPFEYEDAGIGVTEGAYRLCAKRVPITH